MDFDLENPFQSREPISDPKITAMYFLSECYYKPPPDYQTNPSLVYLRRQASVIFQQYAATGARDPVIPYLAMNYFDLYVYAHGAQITQGLAMGNHYRTPIFITGCFIVAWKMRKPVFRLPDFLILYNLPYGLIDEIESLEQIIDGWLQHRHLNDVPIPHQNVKRPVTSFCFLDYLIRLSTEFTEDEAFCLKNLATHKLYALQWDMRYTMFKPSIVAAAAIAFWVDEYYEYSLGGVLDAFVACEHLSSDSLKAAIEMTVPGLKVETGNDSSDDDDDNSADSKVRPESSVASKKKQQQISALSNSLAAALTQSLKIIAPAQLTFSAPDRPRSCEAPADQIPIRLGLTPSELPPRKRGITVEQISREAKEKGKLCTE